ncbi:MAG TPA: Na+/H+ antiporter NhaA [Bacteroides sp.]|nr:Na+/H+ antiporter NhaA [Bacteroides sp.]
MVKRLLITPFQKFVRIESFSGILLFGVTILALIWANSSFRDTYHAIWQFKLGISAEHFEFSKPLILWINDGLMAIFFFLIGLEIKRELLIGELNSLKKAAFPLFAAVGGMLVPIAFFFLLNRDPGTRNAWGISMATDIAFSLAIITLLGKRVPLSLKIFLTAFAIVDDLGAVMVIAIFYSSSIKWMLLIYAVILLIILYILAYRAIHAKYLILAFGIVIWFLFLKAGIHPTIAGVLLAFAVPIRQKIDIKTYSDRLCQLSDKIKAAADNDKPILTNEQIEELDNLEDWTSLVQSPLQQLEHKLHNWVAFLIMPLFALSNSGVAFSGELGLDTRLSSTIAISLVAGKFFGIFLMSWLGVKLRLAELPAGVNYWQVVGIALLAGVGFTMSIFIANLAFPDNVALLDSAKVGILIGSFVAGVAGYFVLRLSCTKQVEDEGIPVPR